MATTNATRDGVVVTIEPLRSLWSRGSVAATAALIATFVLMLWATGRPWVCKTGIGLWTGAWSKCTSQHLLDPYSLTHGLHGVLFYWLLRVCAPRWTAPWRLFAAAAIEVGWELLENSAWVIERYRQHTASLDYVGDSILNSTGDVLATLVGFALAARVSWKWSVAVFLVVELGLLLTIRDNLSLNVLMLFMPSDGIKQWQMGIGG